MSLSFPSDARCMVAGCTREPTHLLSLRMRRQDTGASWAPNQPAFFCDLHANSGAEIEVRYCPTCTDRIVARVLVGFNEVSRITRIKP